METRLTIREFFRCTYRDTEGFGHSLIDLLQLELMIPAFEDRETEIQPLLKRRHRGRREIAGRFSPATLDRYGHHLRRGQVENSSYFVPV